MAEETTEQRLARLEEARIQQQAASLTLLDIVKGIDGTVRSVQVEGAIVDARLGAIDARLSAVDARVGALSQDVITSFRQLAADRAQEEQRLNERLNTIDAANDEHNDDLIRWRNDVIEHVNKVESAMNAKFNQVIALLTKQAE